MKSIAIDPQTGKFALNNGRMRYTKDDLEFQAQVVMHELSLFLGEWFMDTKKGLPYIPKKQRKSEHRKILEAALRVKLMNIRGVKKTISFTPLYDKKERLYQVDFVLQTDYGTLKDAWKNIIGGE